MRKKRNKVVIKDPNGTRWWVNLKTKKVWPTHWKLQAIADAMQGKEKK